MVFFYLRGCGGTGRRAAMRVQCGGINPRPSSSLGIRIMYKQPVWITVISYQYFVNWNLIL